LCENIVDKDIDAKEMCHLLLELPLSECSHWFVVLNIGKKVFKQVKIDTYNVDIDIYLIDAYTNRPTHIEHLALIDVTKSWSYDKHRHGEKWLPWKNASIVRVFPRFNSVLDQEDDKFIEFCWSELVLYKTLRDFHIDIGNTTDGKTWAIGCLPSIYLNMMKKKKFQIRL
jgi:hypothetical protein